MRTNSNPADILSRGIDPRELSNFEMWWGGPHWLRESSDYWPNEVIPELPRELEEI